MLQALVLLSQIARSQTLVDSQDVRRVRRVFWDITRAGAKTKSAATVSFLFPDAGRLTQSA